jgi:hypothetical protein
MSQAGSGMKLQECQGEYLERSVLSGAPLGRVIVLRRGSCPQIRGSGRCPPRPTILVEVGCLLDPIEGNWIGRGGRFTGCSGQPGFRHSRAFSGWRVTQNISCLEAMLVRGGRL